MAGQSNAAGASNQPTEPRPGKLVRASSRELATIIADPWVVKSPAVQKDLWVTSPWPAFAGELEHVGLVTSAPGGTCLIAWSDETDRWNPRHADQLYDRTLLGWITAGSPPIEAVLWLQGECDAARWKFHGWTREEATIAYRDRLMALADAFLEETGAPLIVAPLSLRWCRWENVDCDPERFEPDHAPAAPIAEAAEQAIALHPSILRGPVLHDLRLMPDAVHIWDVNELGRRWAASVEAAR